MRARRRAARNPNPRARAPPAAPRRPASSTASRTRQRAPLQTSGTARSSTFPLSRRMLSSHAASPARARTTGPMHGLYALFRPLLFATDPELAHRVTLRALDAAARSGFTQRIAPRLAVTPIEAMGIRFPNRVGLAAGLDKNAEH